MKENFTAFLRSFFYLHSSIAYPIDVNDPNNKINFTLAPVNSSVAYVKRQNGAMTSYLMENHFHENL